MRYALVKFRVYLLGEQTFALYTDHASLRTTMKSPHLSQRMAQWLSFFAKYNFVVHYKSGKSNILADALSRRPDYDPRSGSLPAEDFDDEEDCAVCVASGVNAVSVRAVGTLRKEIASAYAADAFYSGVIVYLRDPSESALRRLTVPMRASIARYSVNHRDAPRIVVPCDNDVCAQLLHEYHAARNRALDAEEKAQRLRDELEGFAERLNRVEQSLAVYKEQVLGMRRYVGWTPEQPAPKRRWTSRYESASSQQEEEKESSQQDGAATSRSGQPPGNSA